MTPKLRMILLILAAALFMTLGCEKKPTETGIWYDCYFSVGAGRWICE